MVPGTRLELRRTQRPTIRDYDKGVRLPDEVLEIVENRASEVPFSALKRAAQQLSQAYREGKTTAQVQGAGKHLATAYLVTRFPATYAAAYAALSELRARLPNFQPRSLLDLGAGTGSVALAARQLFEDLQKLTLIEPELAFIDVGREVVPEAEWICARISRFERFEPHDLVVASYVLGEFNEEQIGVIARRAWEATQGAFIAIEPGSPRGFARIRRVRDVLLHHGARMVAPCPSEGPCPQPADDWCHFAQRVERSSLHRRLKDARLPYEDEKFSYVIVARDPGLLPPARIIRRPVHSPGVVTLQLCLGERLAEQRVSKRYREAFRAARHAAWGDAWEFPLPQQTAREPTA